MLSSLHTIARLGTLAFAALSLAALTAAQLQVRPAVLPTRTNPWEALASDPGFDATEIQLVNRVDGGVRGTTPPKGDRWEYLTTARKMADDGSMEAVGRYATSHPGDAGDTEGEIGLFRVRLPDWDVLERVTLDVIPTGRPTWDPQDDGLVVFPGATGQLYSYRFTPGSTGEGSAIAPIEWRCPPPGGVPPFMIDPTWARLPGRPNILVVSLSLVRSCNEPPVGNLIAPWWLELDEAREGIVAAGPLLDPTDPLAQDPNVRLRRPTVVADDDGALRAVFARQDIGKSRPLACSAVVEPTADERGLRIRPGSIVALRQAAAGAGSMVASLDGRTVFVDLGDGRRVESLALSPAKARASGIETAHATD